MCREASVSATSQGSVCVPYRSRVGGNPKMMGRTRHELVSRYLVAICSVPEAIKLSKMHKYLEGRAVELEYRVCYVPLLTTDSRECLHSVSASICAIFALER